MGRMRVDVIRAERQREREAELRKMQAERERAREAEQRRVEAERQRVREKKRRAAKQKMEEENIKKQTLAPLPAVTDRRADVPLSQYKYNDDGSGVDNVYLNGDSTAKAFFNDANTRDIIKKRDVNVEKFKERFYHYICAADSLWAWCHEQIETSAFNSKMIMKRLVLALGMPYDLSQYPKSAANFRFMKYYFRQWRKRWSYHKNDTVSYKGLSAEEILWTYFRYWYCDFRIGPIICHRADLVESEFEFSSKPAKRASKEPSYALKKLMKMEKDIIKLYEYENCNAGAVKRNDSENISINTAVVYHEANKLNDEDNDIFDDNVVTAGGYHQVISDESPPTKDNKKDDELKENYFKEVDGNKHMNDELTAKESKGQAIITNDKSNKDLKVGAKKADDEHKYDYSEEEEQEEEEEDNEYNEYNDDEWNNCYSREDEADDDDMSLCGKVPSETDYSLVEIK